MKKYTNIPKTIQVLTMKDNPVVPNQKLVEVVVRF